MSLSSLSLSLSGKEFLKSETPVSDRFLLDFSSSKQPYSNDLECWGYSGVTFGGTLGVLGGHFGGTLVVTLVVLWGHFGDSW